MSVPIISVTSALPLTLSLSIRSFNILLAMLSVCFVHSWLNNSPNTTVAEEEGLPFLESAYLSVWTSKRSQSKNWCYQVITRQPSEIIRQNLTAVLHAQKSVVQPFSVQGPLILSCWNFGLNYKRGWVFCWFLGVFFLNGVVKGRNQPSRT